MAKKKTIFVLSAQYDGDASEYTVGSSYVSAEDAVRAALATAKDRVEAIDMEGEQEGNFIHGILNALQDGNVANISDDLETGSWQIWIKITPSNLNL